MYKIEDFMIPQWRKEGNYWVPQATNVKCPHCAEKVTLTLDRFQHNPHCDSLSALASCPSCGKVSHFWIISPTQHRKTDNHQCRDMFMYPAPKVDREPDFSDIEDIPENILEDYQSAVNVFNIGEWNATAVCCRRIMEGLMHHLLDPDMHNKPLFQQMQKLPEKHDMSKPILELATSIREGGNWGAHFSPDSKPDERAASLMIEFVEYFLQYVLALPHKVDRLSKQIREAKK